MKLKRFIKRMNRGVALAVLLVAGVAVYVVVENVRFNSSKDDIKSTFESYVEDYLKASESDVDGIWKAEDAKREREELLDVVDKYWTGNNIKSETTAYYSVYSDVRASIMGIYGDEVIKQSPLVDNVKDSKFNISKMKVKKFGTNGAILTCTFDVSQVVPAYRDYPDLLGYSDGLMWDEELSNNVKYDEVSSGQESMSGTYEGSIVFRYEDGEWKICSWDVFTTNVNYTEPTENGVYDIKTGEKVEEQVSSEEDEA